MANSSNQVHAPEHSSTEQNESAIISLPPTYVENTLLLLTLPKGRFKKNTSSGDLSPPLSGEGTSLVLPPAVDAVTAIAPSPVVPVPNNTVEAPPMPEDEHQIAAPLLPFPFLSNRTAEQGSDQNPLEALMIMVERNEDIIKSLARFAKEKGFFILGASGIVSNVELLNQQDAPVKNTTLQGTFEIISLDGNIVVPGKNQANWLTVLVSGKDSRVRGGPARRLIAGSNVQIVVGTISPSMESLTRQQFLRRPELLHFPNYRNRDWLTTEVVNQIHKFTLKELNYETTNTPSAGTLA